MRPSVVLLDAADTLFTERTSRAALYAEVLGELGPLPDQATLAGWMGAVHDELPERWHGHVRYSDGWFREFVARLLARAGIDADPEPVRARLAERFTSPASYLVFADAHPTLEELTARGLRLGLVSNWSDRLPGLLEQLDLSRWFEVLAVSAAVGLSKPDPALYRWTLARLDVPPTAALHVGDHPVNDLAAARRAGLSALLLDRRGRHPPGPDVLASLAELPDRLGD